MMYMAMPFELVTRQMQAPRSLEFGVLMSSLCRSLSNYPEGLKLTVGKS